MEQKADLRFLGDHAVYPGHAITIAYLIAMTFKNLEEAEATTPAGYPAGVADSRIPGAGGNIYSGLLLLRHLRDGLPYDLVLSNADREWLDETATVYAKCRKEGQRQADALKHRFAEDVLPWLTQHAA
jgi:hypothetical protein